MKKRFSMVIAIVLIAVMALTGCSGSSSEAQAKKAVDGVLGSLKAGEYLKIADYVNMNAEDEVGWGKVKEFIADPEAFKSLLIGAWDIGPGEEEMLVDGVMLVTDELAKYTRDKLITSYTVGEPMVEGDTATIPAAITLGFDPEAVEDVFTEEALQKILMKYFMNGDFVMEVMEMEDEPDYERLYEEYIKPVIPDMTHEVVDQILGTGETTWGLTFEVIRQGDKWVVDDMSAPELEEVLGI